MRKEHLIPQAALCFSPLIKRPPLFDNLAAGATDFQYKSPDSRGKKRLFRQVPYTSVGDQAPSAFCLIQLREASDCRNKPPNSRGEPPRLFRCASYYSVADRASLRFLFNPAAGG